MWRWLRWRSGFADGLFNDWFGGGDSCLERTFWPPFVSAMPGRGPDTPADVRLILEVDNHLRRPDCCDSCPSFHLVDHTTPIDSLVP